MGDFNLPNVDFNGAFTTGGPTSFAQTFLDIIHDLYLFQHVDFPTRVQYGQEHTKVDLIFTNEIFVVNNLEVLPPIGKSDHVGLALNYLLQMDPGYEK